MSSDGVKEYAAIGTLLFSALYISELAGPGQPYSLPYGFRHSFLGLPNHSIGMPQGYLPNMLPVPQAVLTISPAKIKPPILADLFFTLAPHNVQPQLPLSPSSLLILTVVFPQPLGLHLFQLHEFQSPRSISGLASTSLPTLSKSFLPWPILKSLGSQHHSHTTVGMEPVDVCQVSIRLDPSESPVCHMRAQVPASRTHTVFALHWHNTGECLGNIPKKADQTRPHWILWALHALRILETPIKESCKFKAYKRILFCNPREVPICLLLAVQLLGIISKGCVLCSACSYGHLKPGDR